MRDADRFRLRFGPYRTPHFRYGSVKRCALRGNVKIVGLSNGRIPWPVVTKPGRGGRSLLLYGDLAKAVQREAGIAVAHWWGVGPDSVSRWRRALGVGRSTKGSHALRVAHNREPWAVAARKNAWAKSKTPEALAKLAAAMRGKPPPKHVIEAARRARLGMKHTAEARKKMSDARRRRGNLPPGVRPWTKAEDALVRRLPPAEAARQTGRSLAGVRNRRWRLGMPDGRRRGSGKTGRWAALDAEGRMSRRMADGRWRRRGKSQ